MEVYETLLCQDADHSHASLRHLLDVHVSNDLFMEGSNELLHDLFDVLIPFLLWSISSQMDPTEIPSSFEALHIILQYGGKLGRLDDAVKLCRQMLLTESGTRMLLVQFAALHPPCPVSKDIREILLEVYGFTSSEEYDRTRSYLTVACKQFCNGGDDGNDDVPLDCVRLCAAFVPWMWSYDQTGQALAKAIEKYHRTEGWRKALQRRDYWYSVTESPTPEELFKEDQGLACEILKGGWNIPTELVNALWLFVPGERSEEVLRSISDDNSDYRRPSSPIALSTVPEESENGQGGTSTAEGGQDIEDAGQELLKGVGQNANRGESDVDVNAGDVQAGDGQTDDQDRTECEAAEVSTVEGGGDHLAGGGCAEGMFTMAGN